MCQNAGMENEGRKSSERRPFKKGKRGTKTELKRKKLRKTFAHGKPKRKGGGEMKPKLNTKKRRIKIDKPKKVRRLTQKKESEPAGK